MAAGDTFIHLGGDWRVQVNAPNEFLCADNWIADVLAADPAIAGIVEDRVYQGQPPDDSDYPLLTYEYTGAEDDSYTYGSRLANLIYTIQVIEQIAPGGEYPAANAVFTRMIAVLDTPGETETTDGWIIASQRIRPLRQEETKEV